MRPLIINEKGRVKMDWTNRVVRPPQSNKQPERPEEYGQKSEDRPESPRPVEEKPRKEAPGSDGTDSKSNLAFLVILISSAILIVALALFIALTPGARQESSYVNKERLQAVFLNGGQVYFGRIRVLDNNFIRLTDVYYLRVNEELQPEGQASDALRQQGGADIELVKLGCELHGPEDEMLINREQVIFWENLKEEGQVSQAVINFIQNNPEGQQCNNEVAAPAELPPQAENQPQEQPEEQQPPQQQAPTQPQAPVQQPPQQDGTDGDGEEGRE
jgi:hypothetical protein